MAETTTIGLRRQEVQRWALARERVEVETPYGTVAAEAEGVCIRLPQEEIERVEEELGFWKVVPD